jgi:hypothetical protein
MSTTDRGQPVALRCPQCGAQLAAQLAPSAAGCTICQYCGSSLVWAGGGIAPGVDGALPSGASGEAVRGLRLKQFTYTDTAGTGLELFRMLVPVGWKSQGGCRWVLDNPGMPASVAIQLWNPGGAAPGRLEANAGLFVVMISSFQLNPHWYVAYKSIVQQMAQQQIQRIRSIGQIGQIYAQTGRGMREQNLQDWYARQDVYDRLSTDWSRTLRGVDGFYDPHREEVVELPSGYGHAWANNLGEYVLTEDPNFNPNIHSNLHWELMAQQ